MWHTYSPYWRISVSMNWENIPFRDEKMFWWVLMAIPYFIRPGACFSKAPVNTGPDNLPGRLTGNFTGPEIAFLEAPVNFPGTYRARQNSGLLPISSTCFTLVRERRRNTWNYTYRFDSDRFCCRCDRDAFWRTLRSLTSKLSLCQRRATERDRHFAWSYYLKVMINCLL